MPPERLAPAESEKKEVYENEFSLESRRDAIGAIDKLIERELAERGWPEDAAYRFSLAVHEALANAIIHGNLGLKMEDDESGFPAAVAAAEESEENKSKRVKVHVRLSKDDARVQVKDEGAFVPDVMVDPTSEEKLLKGSGRGFLIIDAGVDSLQFSPGEIILYKQNRGDEDRI